MPKIIKPAWVSSCIQCHSHFRFCGALLALFCFAVGTAQAQSTNYVLGTTSLLVGPAAGTNSVVLGVTPVTGSWTATANTNWLHLSPANQSGTGSTNVIFSYDANPGATRSGTLAIGDQMLTVMQAGATYVAAFRTSPPPNPYYDPPLSAPVLVSANLNKPQGVAVDGAGNVYIADTGDNAIKKWTATNNSVVTLVDSGISGPLGVAVDGAGNVYIADTGNNAIKEWVADDNTLTTLISSNLSNPSGVAVDGAGNLYFSDSGNHMIKEWTVANSNVTTLVGGFSWPCGVAVDVAGNVYIADNGNAVIKEWTPSNNALAKLVGSGLGGPFGAAVDDAGNVYIADTGNNAIKQWTAAKSKVTPLLSSGLNSPHGVAVDVAGNVYIADTDNNAVKELPYVFVDPTPRLESLDASNDALPMVLPATANLLAPFTPTNVQPWVAMSGITNGVVSFSLTASVYNRTADIILLGQTIPILQRSPLVALANSLGTTALLEAPAAGSDSVVLALIENSASWTNSANVTWLHLSPANQSGTGSTNIVFSYDANPGPTRSGTLAIDGLTLSVTQAGSTYVAAGEVTPLVATGLYQPSGVAVDGAGNVYVADTANNALKQWTMANNTVTTLVSSGLRAPFGVAVDGAANVYIADTFNGSIKEWTAANNTVATLVCSGLTGPFGVAVDTSDNVYLTDNYTSLLKEWTAASNPVLTLTMVSSGLLGPNGVGVDGAGNVYIADSGSNAIEEWMAANDTMITLVSSGLYGPSGVAVDGAGNVYIADDSDSMIMKWTAANNTMATLVSSGLSSPYGVAVDGAENVYIADTLNNAIKELPRAFVDPTPKLEGLAAGSDALPAVLPVTENLLPPFAPTSDQSWLTITGATNGVVSFSFAANTGPARTANITLLGQTIPITQGVIGTSPTLSGAQALGNGVVQFIFTNTLSASFTVLSTTNLSLPLTNWTVVGAVSNTAPGVFQFTSPPTTNDAQRFYSVRSP